MSEKKSVRLNKLAKEFNVSMDRILSFLENKELKELARLQKFHMSYTWIYYQNSKQI